ncbi:MAG: tRNA (adenosine(37)-N6)-threonylcarbamoyltransferase complex transferase subunit TsaD [Patescibacteria group bacterium]|nr:tRNA (adenosine(37)-N6)-threonylcarbamoyltransferase complex transferase subunit TsaD [Patescibacteria group bacterium]
MRILAIETSCDETAIALLEAKGGIDRPFFKIIKSFVSSQIKIHAPFGGVVPSLAKRQHLKNLPLLLEKVLGKDPFSQKQQIEKIDLIAVTVGPGLEPALWTGISFAQQLSQEWEKPLVGANHLEGHLFSFLLSSKFFDKKKSESLKNYSLKLWFPAISLIVSGGHTILVLLKNLKNYQKIGETLDDAVGESFDKVARLLGLSYPGGPEIERLAKKGNAQAIAFPLPMISQKNFNFSYSGLKTAVLYYLRDLNMNTKENNHNFWKPGAFKINPSLRQDIAASFQRAAFLPLVKKSSLAALKYQAKSIFLGGGVAANKKLAQMIRKEIKDKKIKANLIVPPLSYCLDNAVMIGVAAYLNKLSKKRYPLKANGNLNL